jgi:Tol biopolymer transport system component
VRVLIAATSIALLMSLSACGEDTSSAAPASPSPDTTPDVDTTTDGQDITEVTDLGPGPADGTTTSDVPDVVDVPDVPDVPDVATRGPKTMNLTLLAEGKAGNIAAISPTEESWTAVLTGAEISEFWIWSADDDTGTLIDLEVQSRRYAADGSAVTYIRNYDTVASGGELMLWDVAAQTKVSVSDDVRSMQMWTPPQSDAVAFIRHFNKTMYGGELAVWDRTTGSEAIVDQLVKPGAVSFSPDGRRLLYFLNDQGKDGPNALCLWDRDTQAVVLVVQNTEWTGHGFTSDGGTLTFLKSNKELMRYDLEADSLESLSPYVRWPKMIDEGTSLLYVDALGTLTLHDLQTNTTTTLGEDVDTNVLVSTDERRLVYFVGRQGNLANLRVWDRDTNTEAVVRDSVNYTGLRVALDGRTLVFIDGTDFDHGRLVLYDVDTAEEIILSEDASIHSVTFAPDGGAVAYIDEPSHMQAGPLRLWRRGDSEIRTLSETTERLGVAFTSQGSHLVFIDEIVFYKGTLRALWVDDPTPQAIADGVGFTLSPAASFVVFDSFPTDGDPPLPNGFHKLDFQD